ncbi:MAG TPA: hypothetical protein VF006_20040 [Longimicrobium sp.]
MSFFTQAAYSQLLLGQTQTGDVGTVVAVLPAAPPPDTGYEISDVLTSQALNASIVFLQQPAPTDAATQQELVNAVLALAGANGRVLAWGTSAGSFVVTNSQVTYAPLQWTGATTVALRSGLTLPVVPTLSVALANGMALTAQSDSIQISGPSNSITFTGASQPANPTVVSTATVPFSGANRGCVQFTVFLTQPSLAAMNWGFTFGAPATTGSTPVLLNAPLAVPRAGAAAAQFSASFDPLDPYNQFAPDRTALSFAGIDSDRKTTVLTSAYTTPGGNDTVLLTPVSSPGAGQQAARLVFEFAPVGLALPQYLSLAPEGDFTLSLGSGSTAPSQILCGLQGTEYLVFQPANPPGVPGDFLRFASEQAAYAPGFPFATSSPVSAPQPEGAGGLVSNAGTEAAPVRWMTSYAALFQGGSTATTSFVAQPPGFNLYGNDEEIHGSYPSLMGHLDPATPLPAVPAQFFPLVPYSAALPGDGAAAFDAQQMQDFEAQVLGPLRRAALGSSGAGTTLSAVRRHAPRALAADADAPVLTNYVTPSGYLFTLSTPPGGGAGTWTEILLGLLEDGPQQLAFLNPGSKLQQAFQSGQLFLVDANGVNLGTQGGSGAGGAAAFANELTIGGWQMAAQPGLVPGQQDQAGAVTSTGSTFGSYANVVIVKGVQGALWIDGNPQASWVCNPAKWTMADDFAAPVTPAPGGTAPNPPDPTQLANLSLWLQQYFAAAAAEGAGPDASYFASFNALAADPAWTGVLVLRGVILAPPTGLAGLMAGISDPSLFNVHHLAVPLSPVSNPATPPPDAPAGPQVLQSSSISGLIYYLDPLADPANPALPVATDPALQYDFRVNSLKVLFANSDLQAFSSYAQVTLRTLFGSAVTGMGSGGTMDAVVLTGTYQMVGGQPVYAMTSTADSPFLLASGVLSRVEVTGMQMTTVSADPDGSTESAFTMTGFLDLAVVPGGTDPVLDLFGYGNLTGQTLPHQGLSFQALALDLTFPTQTPTQRTFLLDYGQMQFDLQTSTLRPGSLVDELQLQLTALLPAQTQTAAQLGYLPVAASFPAGTLGSAWFGLSFQLNLGTPGELASAAGLNSALLLAWNPAATASDGTGVQVGLQLPGTAQGAPLISLQNVLKLSIGPIQLLYDNTAKSYLLLLNELALSFLGLLKLPPNGATAFYLFGDPSGGQGSSQSGLGWYAIYNNEPSGDDSTVAATEILA